jgi:hypothetical protein
MCGNRMANMATTSEGMPMVEKRTREHLRDDKLQQDWEWPLKDRR